MNQVFDEPLLMSAIAENLSINDMVNLKVSGNYGTRFQDTLAYEIDKREEELHAKKLADFEKTVALIVKEPKTTLREGMRQLNHLFDFLSDNMWFRDEPKFKHMDDVFQAKLIRLATERNEEDRSYDDYSHDALFYLEEIYGIHVKAEYDENTESMMEYIEDLDGNKYRL
jgi:hypothetical protein